MSLRKVLVAIPLVCRLLWVLLYHSIVCAPLRWLCRRADRPRRIADISTVHVERWLGPGTRILSSVPLITGSGSFVSRITCRLKGGETKSLVCKEYKTSAKNLILSVILSPLTHIEHVMYTILAKEIASLSPQVFYCFYSWWTEELLVVMEDLGHLKGGQCVPEGDIEAVEQIIISCATLRRATVSYQEKLPPALHRIVWPSTEDDLGLAIGPLLWKKLASRKCDMPERYADRFLAHEPTRKMLDLLFEKGGYVRIHEMVMRNPRWKGLCHGDARVDNFFYGQGRKVLVDWQAVAPAAPGRDLAWTILFDLSTALRRENQRRLVELYSKVAGLPEDDVWESYLQGLVYTSQVGALMCVAIDLNDPDLATKVLPVLDTLITNILAAVEDENLLQVAQSIITK